jgi:hypothetical protein
MRAGDFHHPFATKIDDLQAGNRSALKFYGRPVSACLHSGAEV